MSLALVVGDHYSSLAPGPPTEALIEEAGSHGPRDREAVKAQPWASYSGLGVLVCPAVSSMSWCQALANQENLGEALFIPCASEKPEAGTLSLGSSPKRRGTEHLMDVVALCLATLHCARLRE